MVQAHSHPWAAATQEEMKSLLEVGTPGMVTSVEVEINTINIIININTINIITIITIIRLASVLEQSSSE